MADKFAKFYSSYDGPATDGFTVIPADATVFAQPTRALYVGGAGNVTVRMISNNIVTFSSVPVGTVLPIRITAVFANSTATSIVGMF
jgi:hypothetical protein